MSRRYQVFRDGDPGSSARRRTTVTQWADQLARFDLSNDGEPAFVMRVHVARQMRLHTVDRILIDGLDRNEREMLFDEAWETYRRVFEHDYWPAMHKGHFLIGPGRYSIGVNPYLPTHRDMQLLDGLPFGHDWLLTVFRRERD